MLKANYDVALLFLAHMNLFTVKFYWYSNILPTWFSLNDTIFMIIKIFLFTKLQSWHSLLLSKSVGALFNELLINRNSLWQTGNQFLPRSYLSRCQADKLEKSIPAFSTENFKMASMYLIFCTSCIIFLLT